MYYTSNERDSSSLSNVIFISENKHEVKENIRKCIFLT